VVLQGLEEEFKLYDTFNDSVIYGMLASEWEECFQP